LVIFLASCSLGETASTETQDKAQPKKVLIVTGIDYPGHKWKLTAPVLAKAIAADKRLKVTVTEKPGDLANDNLGDYDTIVLHFMDWEVPDPGPEARANLKRVVKNGTGLVLVHFACGAFQEWPEFVELAGRVWDPKLRGHDPHGKFKVQITDSEHPAMKGLSEFETVDELYTCLTGKTPIKILAMAR
jgi:type 1 glutamine amidotransferase